MRSLIAAVGLAALAACGSEPPQPIVHLPLDEPQGIRFADASGHGHDGLAESRAGDPAPSAGGLYMDGESGRMIRIAGSDLLRSTGRDITISAWAWRNEGENVAIVAHDYPALFFGFHGFQFKWEITLEGGKRAKCYADRKFRARLGQWHHVAATWDGWVARLYVDGEEICSDWTRGGSIALTDRPFTIGGYEATNDEIIDVPDGRIAQVLMYDRALGATAIAQLARPLGQISGPPRDPIGKI
jgi:hypothetical protein